jgi:RNA polymerase sigma-70 factor (ECF subfamily)
VKKREEPRKRRPPLAAIQTAWGTIKQLQSADARVRAAAWADFHVTYRPSIVAYVRRFLGKGLGHDAGEELSEEVTQAFIAEAFEKGSLTRADPAKGRFRQYLQAALHHYCCNWLDYRNAQRRNPPAGSRLLRLDALAAIGQEPARNDEAAEAFDRLWASSILKQALDSLRRADPEAAARIDDLAESAASAPDSPRRPPLAGAERVRRHRALERLREHFAAVLAQTVSRQELRTEEWKGLSKYLPSDLREPSEGGPSEAR